MQRRAFVRFNPDEPREESEKVFQSVLNHSQHLLATQTGCAMHALDSLVQLATSRTPDDVIRNVSALWNANLSGYCNVLRTQLGWLHQSTDLWWSPAKRGDGAAS